MTSTEPSRKRDYRGLTKRQEAFSKLVALQGLSPTEAASQVYQDSQHVASRGSRLLRNDRVRARIDELVRQQAIIQSLSRDSLTADSIEIQREARADGKYSAAVAATRLAGDLQGLTTSNPVAEATQVFLSFLAGDKPAMRDVQVLGEGGGSSSAV